MIFYLGVHQPGWLARFEVPMFVSHSRLARYRKLPRARSGWALDSGGFTELSLHGAWRSTAEQYLAAVVRYDAEIGNLEWASPQDWMCEPHVLARTGLTVAEHQRRTVDNFLRLRDGWDHARSQSPFMPVLQGWTADDYQRCAEAYDAAGVDLTSYPVVGLGSVCRRQATVEIADLIAEFSKDLLLHAYGVKISGLKQYGADLESTDSMAWSFSGRHQRGCGPSHATEANCARYALAWRDKAIQAVGHYPTYPQHEREAA
jgi:hypothetical protein